MSLSQSLRIVSGGQTGVDRAALDAALKAGLPCGGWCPKGRRAEDGVIDERYSLTETPTANYAERTELNVVDSDGTLVLSVGEPSGGTALTVDFTRQHQRPCLVVDLNAEPSVAGVSDWIREHDIGVLNVAGPREDDNGTVYPAALAFLWKLFAVTP